MSAIASEFRQMWWWSRSALVLRLIRRRLNRRPSRSTRAAKHNMPISESSFHLVVLRGAVQLCQDFSKFGLWRISWWVECSSNPRKVRLVLGCLECQAIHRHVGRCLPCGHTEVVPVIVCLQYPLRIGWQTRAKTGGRCLYSTDSTSGTGTIRKASIFAINAPTSSCSRDQMASSKASTHPWE